MSRSRQSCYCSALIFNQVAFKNTSMGPPWQNFYIVLFFGPSPCPTPSCCTKPKITHQNKMRTTISGVPYIKSCSINLKNNFILSFEISGHMRIIEETFSWKHPTVMVTIFDTTNTHVQVKTIQCHLQCPMAYVLNNWRKTIMMMNDWAPLSVKSVYTL